MTNLEVLLVYKKSRLEVYEDPTDAEHVQWLIKTGHLSVRDLQSAHDAHVTCLNKVCYLLEQKSIPYTTHFRGDLTKEIVGDKLVITVGGDGTLLEASHYIDDNWVLGVNSDKERSVGKLCAAHADTVENMLQGIIDQAIKPTKIMRLSAVLDGKALPFFSLNELLVTHRNPAATSRYIVRIDGRQEEQLSSGMWIAAPAGSTAAILSAGGSIQNINDQMFQYRVREPFMSGMSIASMLSGVLKKSEKIHLTSKMLGGKIYCDGPYKSLDFPVGSELMVDAQGKPLNLFVNEGMLSQRL